MLAGKAQIKKNGFYKFEQIQTEKERLAFGAVHGLLRGRVLEDLPIQYTQIGGCRQSIHKLPIGFGMACKCSFRRLRRQLPSSREACKRFVQMQFAVEMIQGRSSFVQSEPPITFELRLREELINRGLLRELNLFASILFHVRRLISGDARFNIENPPRLTMRLRIVNSPNHAV